MEGEVLAEKVAYGGWPNCLRLANERIEAIAVVDVGPRIIHLAVPGSASLFGLLPEELGLRGGEDNRCYGGHRLGHAPEAMPRSYWPDNVPVEATVEGDTLYLRQPVEGTTGIKKAIAVTLLGDQPCLEVRHELTNTGLWPVDLAPWPITIMAQGGMAVVPHSDRPTASGLLPNRVIAIWPYSDVQDPRVHWGTRYVMVRQDPRNAVAFKAGLNASHGWAVYWYQGQLFVKCYRYEPEAVYPDYGCSVEVFVWDRFLELETLAPLRRLEPGACAVHVEHWFLYDHVEEVRTEEDADRIVRPLAEQALRRVAAL